MPMNANGKPIGLAGPTEATIATDGPLATGEHLRPIALAGLTVILIGLCVWLAVPFLSALVWAVALAIIAWPLHKWMRKQIRHPGRAALATTSITLTAIVAPGLFIAYQLVKETGSAGDRMKAESVNSTLRGRMADVPALRQTVEWMDRVNIDLDAEIRKLVTSYVAESTGLLQGSVLAVIHFAIMLFILYHFLKDGPLLRQRVRGLLPMTKAECDRVFASAADSVRANVYATLVTSLIDGVTGGLLFWALGLPSPVLWGVVIFVVSILPILGTFIIWVPATVYLAIVNPRRHVETTLAMCIWAVRRYSLREWVATFGCTRPNSLLSTSSTLAHRKSTIGCLE